MKKRLNQKDEGILLLLALPGLAGLMIFYVVPFCSPSIIP
jgi:ABC-type polysaccharide transport system permease subunit